MNQDLFRKLPSIDSLIRDPMIEDLTAVHGRDLVVQAARSILEDLRSRIQDGASADEGELGQAALAGKISAYLKVRMLPSLRRAVNATGVVLHTGLGRALLSESSRRALADCTTGYCTLATDIETGRRGHRDSHVAGLICELTGAEAATVVNNNAAATMLILNSLASGKEVILSRGQLVEIGGSFRMPDVMAASGAILREVGTTNKTHLRDYRAALGENTAAIMRVHHSNYRITGFFSEPSIEELAELAAENNVKLIDDLGSGALVDLARYGLQSEPLVPHSIKAGADVACFSGDKLIGGPQSGIIVGRKAVIEDIKKNPLARSLRVGKMTLSVLEATLKLFLNPERLEMDHPDYRLFAMSKKAIEARAKKVKKKLTASLGGLAVISIIDGGSQVGSGAVPTQTIPTRLLQIKPVSMSTESLAQKLRDREVPIFTRIQDDAVLMDLRTVLQGEDAILSDAVISILSGEKPS